MTTVAWWTCAYACALFAATSARLYERCELARDLRRLGISPDDVSTWVCIAYHESRFDTTAYNPYSGDHGLLQISQLYWCGPGKACGVPCWALRDDDITDDVDCALQVHEEHTRLQGDGFLAWVVYLQHCKHNTKKYLADCDSTPKNITLKTHIGQIGRTTYQTSVTTEIIPAKEQGEQTYLKTNLSFNNSFKIDELVPPYYHSRLGKELTHRNGINKVDLKGLDVDDLKVPQLRITTETSFHEKTSSAFTNTSSSSTSNDEGTDRKKLRSPFRFRLLKKPTTVPDENKLNGMSSTYAPSSTFRLTSTSTPPVSTTAHKFGASLPTQFSTTATSLTSYHVKDASSFTTERPSTQASRSSIYSQPTSFSSPTQASRSSIYLQPTSFSSSPAIQTNVYPSAATTKADTISSKTTHSIFDLYLNPTKSPVLAAFPKLDSPHRLRIFYDGTTRAPWSTRKSPTGGFANNHLRRETEVT